MNNFLYYNRASTDYPILFPNVQFPFQGNEKIFTHLPKNIVVIRAVAYAAFSAMLAFKLSATVFGWPVFLAGIAFAGWTIYSHILSKDPLMEVFYKIAGGRERFEALPEINLTQAPNVKISKAIKRINWDQLNHPIARAKTLDGRNVVIVKGRSHLNDGLSDVPAQSKSVLAFIERANPDDFNSPPSTPLEKLFTTIMEAIFLRENNNFCFRHGRCRCYEVRPSISPYMANEFFAQMAIPAQ